MNVNMTITMDRRVVEETLERTFDWDFRDTWVELLQEYENIDPNGSLPFKRPGGVHGQCLNEAFSIACGMPNAIVESTYPDDISEEEFEPFDVVACIIEMMDGMNNEFEDGRGDVYTWKLNIRTSDDYYEWKENREEPEIRSGHIRTPRSEDAH